MTKDEILEIIKKQNDYFNTGSTFDIQFRIQALKKLYKAIKGVWGFDCHVVYE